jgi:hypothetical protein
MLYAFCQIDSDLVSIAPRSTTLGGKLGQKLKKNKKHHLGDKNKY